MEIPIQAVSILEEDNQGENALLYNFQHINAFYS